MSNNAFVEPLPFSLIENGLAGEKTQFLFRVWRDNEGIIAQDSGMTQLSQYLLMTLPSAEPGDVPPLTFAGKNSTFRRFFPHALEPETPRPPTSFLPSVYRKGVADAYQVVMDGDPWFDMQRTGNRLGDGVPDMTLQRLLVKFRTSAGFTRIFCLMTLLEVHSRSYQSDRTHRQLNSQQKSDWHPAYQARVQPSSMHGNVPG
jgi:hypothetical protein